MKLERQLDLSYVRSLKNKKAKRSKYEEIVVALCNLPSGKVWEINLSDEKNFNSAQCCTTISVRKLAKGRLEGAIRSKTNLNEKKLYLWVERDEKEVLMKVKKAKTARAA